MHVLILLLALSSPAAATPPGTDIVNVASVNYQLPGQGEFDDQSNPVSILTTVIRTDAQLRFYHHAAFDPQTEAFPRGSCEFSLTGGAQGPFLAQSPPLDGDGVEIEFDATLNLLPGLVYHRGETIFLVVTDADQNLFPLEMETVQVLVANPEHGGLERLRLYETGPDTGRFLGWMHTVVLSRDTENDGFIGVALDNHLLGTYLDISDSSDISEDQVLLDPFSRVFNSENGGLLDDVEITLLEYGTGAPARVFADDGVSSFPATIRSGATVRDGAGLIHDFPPGAYRFPVVEPGEYILQVRPPPGHRFPSRVGDAQLQSLAAAPFHLDPRGSRALSFISGPSRSFPVDLPVDSLRATLNLTKQADRERIGPGEFLAYELELANGGDDTLAGVVLQDRFPTGFRFEAGTHRIEGDNQSAPTIDADGGGISFEKDSLVAGEIWRISYVLAAGPAARPGRAENRAWAEAGGLRSNTALATVELLPDPIAERCRVLGRVLVVDAEGGLHGLPEQRLYLEDGRYALTDAEGRFHFEDLSPGGHLLRLDPGGLPEGLDLSAESGRRVLDLQAGTLWREEFKLTSGPPPQGELDLVLSGTMAGDSLRARVLIGAFGLPIAGRRLLLMPSDGASLVPGTLRMDGEVLADSILRAGANYLEFKLPGIQGSGTEVDLELTLLLPAVAGAVEDAAEPITLQAILHVDDPRNPEGPPLGVGPLVLRCNQESVHDLAWPSTDFHPHFASSSAALSMEAQAGLDVLAANLAPLRIQELRVVGHSDSMPLGPVDRLHFPDNYVLSQARAKTVFEYLGRHLKLSSDDDRMRVYGFGPDSPLVGNGSAENRALNRRVEIQVRSEDQVVEQRWRLDRSSDACRLHVVGSDRTEAASPPPPLLDPGPARFDANWLESADGDFEWLWPPGGHHPAIASMKLVCKRPADWTVEANLNGRPVPAFNYQGQALDSSARKALDRWTGVDLQQGDNLIELVARDADGKVRTTVSRHVHVSGPPVRAELLPEASQLLADGRNPLRIALRLLDADGHPVREGVVGRWGVAPPHRAQESMDELAAGSLSRNRLGPGYRVGSDGVAILELEPSSVAGDANIRLPLAGAEEVLRVWLRPAPRPWILLGFAEGGLAHRSLSGSMDGLSAAEQDEKWTWDGRLSLFARGRVRGSWLLTLAYDSEREFEAGADGFHDGQGPDPEAWYTVYGDASHQGEDAPSARKLYLKLEGETARFLFGDFDTGFEDSKLAAYVRRLNGIRTNARRGIVELEAFAAEGATSFARDEIPGAGHSGPYRLSRRDILPRSERVWIETRDRHRPEQVLSRDELIRDVDYQIDARTGSLRFKSPVPARVAGFDPVIIVADYEVTGEGEHLRHLGLRGRLALPPDRGTLGLTLLQEGMREGDARLAAADLHLKLAPGMRFLAEAAGSEGAALEIGGDALHFELERRDQSGHELLAFHESEPGFGLGQQRLTERGRRRLSFDMERTLRAGWMTELSLRREQDLLPGGQERRLAEGRLSRESARARFELGLRGESDRQDDGSRRENGQLLLGADWRRADDRLGLEFQQEQSLSGRAGSAYPTRTLLGARYRIRRDWTLGAEQEFIWDDQGEIDGGSHLGLEARPWRGGDLEAGFGESSGRLFTLLGLRQSWSLGDHWRLDLGYEHQDHLAAAAATAAMPDAADRAEAFSAGHLAAAWEGPTWSAASRLELRDGDRERLGNLELSTYGEPRPGWGVLARLRGLRSRIAGDDETPTLETDDDELRLGLAHRPVASRWIWLQRVDLRSERGLEASGEEKRSRRVVSRGNLNLRTGAHGQLSLMIAARYLSARMFDTDLVGFSERLALEGRWEFASRWDLGLRAGIRHSWTVGGSDLGLGLSLGRKLGRQLWLSAGYNLSGYQDRDFAAGEYTAHGPFLRLRVALDEEDLRNALQF